MSRIYIINGAIETAVTDHITASASVDLTGVDTLSITLGKPYTSLISDTTKLRFDGQTYNVTDYMLDTDGDAPIVSINAEHISYELNDEQYNVETFAVTGTPEELLTAALAGTPFTVGIVELTGSKTLVINEAATRRAVLLTVAAICGGELAYSGDGTTVNLVTHRGSVTPVDVMATQTVTHVSYSRDKLGDTRAYDLTFAEKSALALGDEIKLKYTPLGIDVSTRIIAMTHDPFDRFSVSFTVGDFLPDIVSSYVSNAKKVDNIIQTFSVSDGKFISKIEVEQLISSIVQSADKIALVVDSGNNIKSAEIVAAINGSGSTVKISADHVEISGDVVLKADLADGETIISGDNIKTGTIAASLIDTANLVAKNVLVKDENGNVLLNANAEEQKVDVAGFHIEPNNLHYEETDDGIGTIRSVKLSTGAIGAEVSGTIQNAPVYWSGAYLMNVSMSPVKYSTKINDKFAYSEMITLPSQYQTKNLRKYDLDEFALNPETGVEGMTPHNWVIGNIAFRGGKNNVINADVELYLAPNGTVKWRAATNVFNPYAQYAWRKYQLVSNTAYSMQDRPQLISDYATIWYRNAFVTIDSTTGELTLHKSGMLDNATAAENLTKYSTSNVYRGYNVSGGKCRIDHAEIFGGNVIVYAHEYTSVRTTTYSAGAYIETVTSYLSTDYPDDGAAGGYYYIKQPSNTAG